MNISSINTLSSSINIPQTLLLGGVPQKKKRKVLFSKHKATCHRLGAHFVFRFLKFYDCYFHHYFVTVGIPESVHQGEYSISEKVGTEEVSPSFAILLTTSS